MSYRIFCFTAILTLAIAPFLFILVGAICELAIVPGVYILLPPQEDEVHYTILLEGTDVQIQQNIYQRLGCCWKKHKKGIQLCYDGVYNETKRHFEIPIYFWFQ